MNRFCGGEHRRKKKERRKKERRKKKKEKRKEKKKGLYSIVVVRVILCLNSKEYGLKSCIVHAMQDRDCFKDSDV